jgi:hypothetical protein
MGEQWDGCCAMLVPWAIAWVCGVGSGGGIAGAPALPGF